MHSLALKMRKGFEWKIGFGNNVLALSSNWVNNKVPFVNLDENLKQCALWRVNDLITPTRSWNVGIVREHFEWDSAQEILTIDLTKEEEDFLYW